MIETIILQWPISSYSGFHLNVEPHRTRKRSPALSLARTCPFLEGEGDKISGIDAVDRPYSHDHLPLTKPPNACEALAR